MPEKVFTETSPLLTKQERRATWESCEMSTVYLLVDCNDNFK